MKIEIFQDRSGEWRFRIIAANNKIVAQSEGYKRRSGAIKTAESIIVDFKTDEVFIYDESGTEVN